MKRVLAGLSLGLAACAPRQMPAVAAAPSGPNAPHEPVAFAVGTARADVTPPVGAATFGHGPDGRVAAGLWSRLYCRAFVIEPVGSPPLAIVPCDLGAISTLLQRKIAAATHDIGIDAPRLMVTATHTHAGPAHYFDGEFYGSIMSSRLPGYDEQMADFLAGRIAEAVHAAYRNRVPAALAWGHADLWGITKNRSLVPYLANHPRFSPPPPDGHPLPAEERAIDPALNLLRIDAVDPARPEHGIYPLGSILFFSMHPTVLPNTNRMYGADVDGVVERALEREMRRKPEAGRRDPLHAVISTSEGDQSPVWVRGTVDEAEEIGGALAEKAWEAYEDAGRRLKSRAVIDQRYLEVWLPNARLLDGTRHLCAQAELGQSAAGGASDHPTSLDWIDDFREGNADWGRADACERPRPKLIAPLQNIASGPYAFPRVAPLAVLQLDDTLVSFVPAEITVTAGARMNAAALAAQRGLHIASHAVIAGLANGYMQYVTTPEEYQFQHYEGASTIYGPMTAPFLGERLSLLTRAMDGEPVAALLPPRPMIGEAAPIAYKTGPSRPRFARPEDDAALDSIATARGPIGLCTMRRDGAGRAPAFCFWWGDGGVASVGFTHAPWLVLVEDDAPRTPVRVWGAPLFPLEIARPSPDVEADATIDDRGLDFETLAHAPFGDARAWSTLLHPTTSEWAELSRTRAVVRILATEPKGTDAVESPAFGPGAMPPTCTLVAERYCGAK